MQQNHFELLCISYPNKIENKIQKKIKIFTILYLYLPLFF